MILEIHSQEEWISSIMVTEVQRGKQAFGQAVESSRVIKHLREEMNLVVLLKRVTSAMMRRNI